MTRTRCRGSTKEDLALYGLWLDVARERPWETKKTVGQFRRKYLDDPFQKNGFIVVSKEYDAAALVSLSREMGRAWLKLWAKPKGDWRETATRLVSKSAKRLRKLGMQKLEAEPVPFCLGYNIFLKSCGFTQDRAYPGGYLMMRVIQTPMQKRAPGGIVILRITAIERSKHFDGIANVQIGYVDAPSEGISIDERKEELVSSMADAIAYCHSTAIEGGKVIGFCSSALVENVAGELQLRNRGLIVNPRVRNRGIGQALLADGLAWGHEKGAHIAYISTHSTNPAKRLYERSGYKTVAMVENLVLDLTI